MANISHRRTPENIGQLLIVGFDGTKMTPRLRALLTRVQPGGVILFARNIRTPHQTWQLLRDCRLCVKIPMFTCIDLEGGQVDRLRDVLGPTPSAAEVFSTRNRKLFRRHGETIGENCRTLGFNLDFAPVLDLAFEASSSVMSTRAVSADPRRTVIYAKEFLAGLRKKSVAGCGKHFPGLGEGKLDSHHDLPVIEKSLKQLWPEDLLPYRKLRAQMPMVMVSHAAYPMVAGDRTPASLSQLLITDILRKRIGYRNLVVSDDLEMGAVMAASAVGESAVAHIRAGGDLCLVCHREDRVQQAYENLRNAAERDPLFARRSLESIQHILAFKKNSAKLLRMPKEPTEAAVQKLSRKLWEFSEQIRLENLVRVEASGLRARRRG